MLVQQAKGRAPEAAEHRYPFQGASLFPVWRLEGSVGCIHPQPSGALKVGIISWGNPLTSMRFLEDCPHCSDIS